MKFIQEKKNNKKTSHLKVTIQCVNIKYDFFAVLKEFRRSVYEEQPEERSGDITVCMCASYKSTLKRKATSRLLSIFSAEQPIAIVFDGKVQGRGKQRLCSAVTQE